MSATLAAISTWKTRNGCAADVIRTPRQGKPAAWFDERPTTPRRPLREIAQEQGAMLRALQDGVPARKALTDRQQAAKARTERAMAGPAHVERPAARPNMTELYREADALAAKLHPGRYALPRKQATAAGNDITFFEVVEFRNGTRRLFQLISNGHGLTQQKLPAQHQIFAARHILEDVAAAAGLYGRTMKICAFGPHPLTNARSRAAGYGETCASKRGLPW
jgi:hypothetical protein